MNRGYISKFLVIGILAPSAYAVVDNEKIFEGRVYGQVNRLGVYADDGYQKNWLFSDNDADSTRLGAAAQAKIASWLTAGAQLEFELQRGRGFNTSQISRTGNFDKDSSVSDVDEDNGSNNINIFYANAWLKHGDYGMLTFGRLATPGEGSGEISMADTYDIGYVGVADMAPGMIFHDKTSKQAVTFNAGPPADTNLVTGNFDAVDGFDVARKNGMKYTSPEFFASLTFAASFGNLDSRRDYGDASLWFKRDFCAISVEAAMAAGKSSHGGKEQSRSYTDLSAGVLHSATGWNLSGSWGCERNDYTGTRARGDTITTKKHKIYYIQLGKRNNFFEIGSTNFAVDYYQGKNSTQIDDKSKAYGLVVEQHISKINGAIFAGIRRYNYQRTVTKYDKINAAAVGMKVAFEVK